MRGFARVIRESFASAAFVPAHCTTTIGVNGTSQLHSSCRFHLVQTREGFVNAAVVTAGPALAPWGAHLSKSTLVD